MSLFDRMRQQSKQQYQQPQQAQQQHQTPQQYQQPQQAQQQYQQPQQARPQQSNNYDPFSRIQNAEGRQGGIYPLPGLYPLLYIDVVKMIRSRKGDDVFVAEFDILKSEVPARPAGTRMSWAVNFRFDASPGNVKAFLSAVMGTAPEEVDADGARFACSPENPCRRRLVRLEASQIETKAGNPFTLCNWRSVPEDVQAQAEDLRSAAGFDNVGPGDYAIYGDEVPF